MPKISAGATLYYLTVNGCDVVINHVLGLEAGSDGLDWFPFKGGLEKKKGGRVESISEGACREVREETRGLVKISPDSIDPLTVCFSTASKHYRMGIKRVSSELCDQFNALPKDPKSEKRELRSFTRDSGDVVLPAITTRMMVKAENAIRKTSRYIHMTKELQNSLQA